MVSPCSIYSGTWTTRPVVSVAGLVRAVAEALLAEESLSHLASSLSEVVTLADAQALLAANRPAFLAKLKELGIAENTLLIAMADNGPLSHNPPPPRGTR